MENIYKQLPFGFRVLVLVALISVFPLVTMYRNSVQLRKSYQKVLNEEALATKSNIELADQFEKFHRLRSEVENLQNQLSIYGQKNSEPFQISNLIRAAAEISSSQGAIVDYLQSVPESSTPDQKTQDIKLGLVGPFNAAIQSLQELLRKEPRLSILNVSALGNDPFQEAVQINADAKELSPAEFRQLSMVRVTATLRIAKNI